MVALAQVVAVNLEGHGVVSGDRQRRQVVPVDHMVAPRLATVGCQELAGRGEGGQWPQAVQSQ